MRWSIVRLIGMRELRDLLRDRRTLFLILGLPVVLYPVFAGVGLLFAKSLAEQATIIGIVGRDNLPAVAKSPDVALGVSAGGPAMVRVTFPVLIENNEFIPEPEAGQRDIGSSIVLRDLQSDDEELLNSRQVDAILVIPPKIEEMLKAGGQIELIVRGREGDESSKLAVQRLTRILRSWARDVKWVRLTLAKLPADFAEPIKITDPIESQPQLKRTTDELRDSLVKMIPFLLIMWTMAGALHPAIDMTAGEKERGTMETLLISPAERLEIVLGKFFATGLFGYLSALWNVGWMALGIAFLRFFLPFEIISMSGLLWCAFLAAPLALLFSAVCIALGVYARSTKEGQYYLMPLFLLTMPLSFWAMAPGVRLSWDLSLIPVTGMSLLQQRLMSPTPGPSALPYLLPVLLSLFVCITLALWWAVRQFHREEVLFREKA